jgi:outer membrane cobalamin receptor
MFMGGASLLAFLPVTAVHAQDQGASAPSGTVARTAPGADPDAQTRDIIVTGTRASLNRALDLKRKSIAVVDSISAEDIGKFPDQNVAESLQHVPGVSIDRSGARAMRSRCAVSVRNSTPCFSTGVCWPPKIPAASSASIFCPPKS